MQKSQMARARKQAKKHLLQLCGTKARYLEVRDRGLADSELRKIRALLGAAGAPEAAGAMQAAGDPQAQPLNLAYEQQVRLCNSLQRLHAENQALVAGLDILVETLIASKMSSGITQLLQSAGVGSMRPNMLIMPLKVWKHLQENHLCAEILSVMGFCNSLRIY